MTEQTPLHLIILAGGSGSRARRDDDTPPKQFAEVGGRTLLAWSVYALADHPSVASLTITCDELWRDTAREAAPGAHFAAPGATRTASTWHAAEILRLDMAPADDDLVAVHDAARPFADAGLLDRLSEAALREGGAVPGMPVADTVVSAPTDVVGAVDYLDRDTLFAVQTPQVFRWGLFHAAHAWAAAEGRSFTDDGGLLTARGLPPVLVPGEEANWKVTTAADLERARRMLR